MKTRTMWAMFAAVLFVGAISGCESKLTRQNFDMIQLGSSTKLEVKNTLGENHLIRQDSEQFEWEDEDRSLTVLIDFDERGHVSRKQWIDAESNVWDDTKPDPEGRKVLDEDSASTYKKG